MSDSTNVSELACTTQPDNSAELRCVARAAQTTLGRLNRRQSPTGAPTLQSSVKCAATAAVHPWPSPREGLQANNISVTVGGVSLLRDVTFSAEPGTVSAVIGPSGAGKSTLVRVLGGLVGPESGQVLFDGYDVHDEFDAVRRRIGLVPQDDVVHRLLTIDEALRYAAALRLPASATQVERNVAVERVLTELDLTEHRHTRIDRLSGGQRKRASVAMELLTSPSLLILDEPTSGLDPALDRQVMTMLRTLADAGRVIVVVTHSLAYLHLCDQVLMLAHGGVPVYSGPPQALASAMGAEDWADIFGRVCSDPLGAHRAHLRRERRRRMLISAPQPAPRDRAAPIQHRHATRRRQLVTLSRRQCRLIVADRCYLVFLVVLPILLACLSLAVPGHAGLGLAGPGSNAPNEPAQVLILLNIAAVFMGTAISIRDLVGERPIFHRERAVGLSVTTHLAAKIGVYGTAAMLQTLLLTAIVVIGKGGPARGALVLGSGVIELYATLAATAVVSAVIGLLLSSLANSNEQILPLLVVTIMVSIVFAGGLIPVTDRTGLDEVSRLLPARWGFAASAATTDLRAMAPLVPQTEHLWTHNPTTWLVNMAALLTLGTLAAMLVRWRVRRPRPHRDSRKQHGGMTAAAGAPIVGSHIGFAQAADRSAEPSTA